MEELRVQRIARRWSLVAGILIALFWIGYFIAKGTIPSVGTINILGIKISFLSKFSRWWGDVILGALFARIFAKTLAKNDSFGFLTSFLCSVCIVAISLNIENSTFLSYYLYAVLYIFAIISTATFGYLGLVAIALGLTLTVGIKYGFLLSVLVTIVAVACFLLSVKLLQELYELLIKKTGLARWLTGY